MSGDHPETAEREATEHEGAGPGRSPMSTPITTMAGALDVAGQKVVVTGGSRGLGWGICRAFAQQGAHVAILDLDAEGGRAAAEELNRAGGGEERGDEGNAQRHKHLFVECDVRDKAMVRAAVDAVLARFARIDVLVNNAGIAAMKPFLDMDADLPEWHRTIDVNLHGTVNMTHAVGNAMRSAGRGGLIVNISSIGGVRCSGSREIPQAGYIASKAALNHLTRSWAVEFAEYDIRVNCIMPGPTRTPLDELIPPEFRARIAQGMLDRRYGEPLEIGALCVFFASPAGRHLDGVVMPHDGGFTCVM